MIGSRRITMARLADRFAAHLHSTQESTQEPNPVLQPLLNRQVQNVMALNDALPFIGPSEADYRGTGPSTDKTWVYNRDSADPESQISSAIASLTGRPTSSQNDLSYLVKGLDRTNPTTQETATTQSGEPRRPGGRVSPIPFNEVQPASGDWVPGLQGKQYTPGTGFIDFSPMQVAGPSSLENWAAGQVSNLARRPTESLQARDTLGNAAHIYNRKIGDVLNEQSGANAITNVSNIFDQYIKPTVSNQAALMGLDRGTGETNAIGAAKAQYMLPMMQQLLGLESTNQANEANFELGRASQFANLGQAQDARQNQAVNQAMSIGGVGRGISNQTAAANQDEKNRLASISQQGAMGFLPGFIPTSVTSTSSGKPGALDMLMSG